MTSEIESFKLTVILHCMKIDKIREKTQWRLLWGQKICFDLYGSEKEKLKNICHLQERVKKGDAKRTPSYSSDLHLLVK